MFDTPPQREASSYFNFKRNYTDNVKNINLALIGGCGLQLSSGPGVFFMEYRLRLGMTNIYKFSAIDGKNETSAFSLSAGYMANIK
jgi:hypothetical protein